MRREHVMGANNSPWHFSLWKVFFWPLCRDPDTIGPQTITRGLAGVGASTGSKRSVAGTDVGMIGSEYMSTCFTDAITSIQII